jgi:hypothetical protein
MAKEFTHPSDCREGDIIGFSGNGLLSAGINLATYGIPFWDIGHVGIVGRYDGKLVLFESTVNSQMPCLIQGRPVSGVQAHRLESCEIYDGKVWHYPLYRELYRHESQRLTAFLLECVGTEYDAIGAFRAGGVGFSFVESRLRRQDLEALFCSELCAAAYAFTGLHPTGNAGFWSPNKLCRTLRRRGVLRKPWRIQ